MTLKNKKKEPHANEARSEVRSIQMNYNNNNTEDIYKAFANTTTIRCFFKAQRKGSWIYLPEQLVRALGIRRDQDANLLVFIFDDPSSSYRFLVLVKDSFIADKLRPLLLDLRHRSEAKLEESRKLAESIASNENAGSTSLSNSV